MDSYEATRIVFSRIQSMDPENASKIMGLLLIQDHGEKEMIRLAFGPESLVHSVILKARKELGFSSNTPSTPSTPSSPSPFSRQNSSRFLNGTGNLPSPSTMNSSAPPFYRNGVVAGENDLVDELQLQEQLSFLNDGSSPPLGPKIPDFFYPGQLDSSIPYWGGSGPHRRSCSVNDMCLGGDTDDVGGGFGWKPCLYFAKGYCKNGTSCRFVHGDDGAAMVGSPDQSKLEIMEQCQELLRSKSAHQQRLAAASQLMGSSNFPYSPRNCMNFLPQQQQNDSPRAAALMLGEEMNKFGRARLERNEFSMNAGIGMVCPGSRQIYLTFPADSTFREEDVSNYFSIFGPVQDVRIPYQQKRMFGFVTFVYPETVMLILAKGNPHFVCDARVLVKPYKEKGKVPDKFRKQQQQMEKGEYSSCGSPTGFDSRDPFDPIGPRMLCNTQDMLWRRRLEEQADLQQAIEIQNRRLLGLQLLDMKKSYHHRALSNGAAIPAPTRSPSFLSHSSFFHSHSDRSSPEEDEFISRLGTPVIFSVDDHQAVNGCEKEMEKEKESSDGQCDENENGSGNGKSGPHNEEIDFPESLEHNLPDSLFASPKAAGDYRTASSTDATDVADMNAQSVAVSGTSNSVTSPFLPVTSSLDMASLKSCYLEVPRFASGHGAIGM